MQTPLVVVDETIPSRDFVVYGRANEGYPTVAGGTPYTGEGAYNAGILYYVPYQHIPNSLKPEPNPERMPDLEAFFGFGGTLELLTPEKDSTGEASTLNKNDLVMSEIMWAIDEGFDENAGGRESTIRESSDPVD